MSIQWEPMSPMLRYGLFASHSANGFVKHVYASGFNDSGRYVGACRDCHALVKDARVERNGKPDREHLGTEPLQAVEHPPAHEHTEHASGECEHGAFNQ